MDYSKLLMNQLTFKENLHPVSKYLGLSTELVMGLGIHSSLHRNCHHQLVFAKFNLKVHYPPHDEREVWDFKEPNTDHIKRAINWFRWEMSFTNLDTKDEIFLINETNKNILSNFIPHESITFVYRDQTFNQWNKNASYKFISKVTKAVNLLQCFSSFRINKVH